MVREAGHVVHSLKHKRTHVWANYSPVQCVAAPMCRNVSELCQTVVTEHSLEAIHLGISAVIVMKVIIAEQY